MADQQFEGAAYRGSKNFSQWDVTTANATGFGAAADDYAERGIDLNEQLIMNKPATFFFRMNSDAMEGAGIHQEDILIVDRSLKEASGKIIIAAIDGEMVVRRFEKTFNKGILSAENKRYANIEINEFTQYQCWGVVTCVLHMIDPALKAFNAEPKTKKKTSYNL